MVVEFKTVTKMMRRMQCDVRDRGVQNHTQVQEEDWGSSREVLKGFLNFYGG